ncbi:16S rRNA (cytidine(1402)-2'-O)-methyltransferase [Acidovorax sp. NCPPB 4044]|uniref:16S rRNA (cytidine(1402)-2'-O)-methyltransferase n=1 Tax=Acidovorax sp. NCPPB 4044 TaxID=2940490 RepID=UPI00230357ED|nr:16S rRNA (cytidine(1402)-2'-O)-methyltransferase [Acidovorax sp. NCPPB 4044]MDA8522751.1 16S rRNA (cytidine(1402)-2'-O)-methyltransferase [Acidovorax sp. NCPPB 4044]
MSASFATALSAARDAAAAQHYPQGALYVVATPIGNLADITLRALHVLQLADAIACEDTRHTQALLRAYGIDKSPQQWMAVHQHNEAEAAQNVLQRLQRGDRVVYVSDAGTPGVSDPGARLVSAVQAAGLRALPLPGASSVTAAISVAGALDRSSGASGPLAGGFVFAGFLPSRATERNAAVQALVAEPRCTVLLEAPHRIEDLAAALGSLSDRQVTLAREITKQFEEIATMPAHALAGWLGGGASRSRGEFVIVVHPAPQPAGEEAPLTETELRMLRLLIAEMPLKTAVRLAAELTGAPRNALYEAALTLKNGPEPD